MFHDVMFVQTILSNSLHDMCLSGKETMKHPHQLCCGIIGVTSKDAFFNQDVFS